MNQTIDRFAFCIVTALLLSGCSHDLAGVNPPCATIADCTGGKVCSGGFCVPAEAGLVPDGPLADIPPKLEGGGPDGPADQGYDQNADQGKDQGGDKSVDQGKDAGRR